MTALEFDLPRPAVRPISWGTVVSLGLHFGLAMALLWLSPLRQLVVPPPAPVAVQIVTPAQFAALQPVAAAALPASPQAIAPPPGAAPAPPSDRLTPSPPLQPDLPQTPTIVARQFYSARILQEPGMAGIRKSFNTLATREQLVQLCNIEGLEQIRRGASKYAPDTLVPYAMSDPLAAGLTLTAAGGAFRSRRKWYGVSFKCTVAPNLEAVTAFAFKLGDPIPEEQWEDHNLNAADEDE